MIKELSRKELYDLIFAEADNSSCKRIWIMW